MTLQQLRYLCEVARRGLNISKTAEGLRISQPGLSRQLQLLEAELGVELFVRNSKRLVRLSDAGAKIVAIAERVLREAHNITEAARESADESSGILTIATTHTQARYALPAVIRRFSKEFPDVRLNLRQGTPGEVSQLVLSGNADISIAAETVDPIPGMVMLPCYELPRVVLTPAGHP